MGRIRPEAPRVLVFFAVFGPYHELLDQMPELLGEEFGAIDLVSERFAFTETDYYAEEMGGPLFKQFFVLRELAAADELAGIKVRSNQLEERMAKLGHPVSRPVNIDPGYLDAGKVVLASTKGPPHRIYLGQGIFAEVTLHYREQAWQLWPWTYPDFRREDFREFLARARREYLRKLSGSSP